MFIPTFVDVDDVLLHVETSGPEGGEPVVFLHGWPDLWLSFEPQMRALAEAGYRTFAPDQRGYGLSSKPAAVADYALPHLARDVVRLVEQLDVGPVHLVGHDWGGMVGWAVTHDRPDLVRSFTAVNCPHPLALIRAMRHPRQLLRAWYMVVFLIPGLADAVLAARGAALQATMLRFGAAVTPELLDHYRTAWRQPGAVSRPLTWYRAMFRTSRAQRETFRSWGEIQPPVQLIWGDGEPVFRPGTAPASEPHCRDAVVHHVDAGHWPHHERPREVTALIQRFLGAPVP